MGSGVFANAGYQRAATHRDIYCFLASGGVQQASLTPQQLSPACYTIDVETAPAPWNSYFYFGGPGGTGC
jgi:hypothetical protein